MDHTCVVFYKPQKRQCICLQILNELDQVSLDLCNEITNEYELKGSGDYFATYWIGEILSLCLYDPYFRNFKMSMSDLLDEFQYKKYFMPSMSKVKQCLEVSQQSFNFVGISKAAQYQSCLNVYLITILKPMENVLTWTMSAVYSYILKLWNWASPKY